MNKQIELSEKQKEKYFNACAKALHKTIARLEHNMGYNNGTVESLLLFMQNDPTIFVFSQHPENRNFLKWALQENIDRNQEFLQKITELEKEYNLPTENIDDPEQ
jgi:hypothetical protein